MKKLLLIPALLVGSLALAEQAKFELSPMIGYNFAEGNLNVKDSGYMVYGLEIQANSANSKISPEISLLYSSGVDYATVGDTSITRGAFNGVYTFDASNSLVPFAKIGAGYERVGEEIQETQNGFFLDAGAGVKVPFTDYLALKLEAIYMAKIAAQNAGFADSNLVTMAGLTFSFGSNEQKQAPKPAPKKEVKEVVQEPTPEPVVVAPVVIIDSDKDGVVDAKDRCPNTPRGVAVDAFGCALDSDKDGVIDAKDRCLYTPRGVAVDASGCALDSDKDGVIDSRDRCANTPRGTKVDALGCKLDEDDDKDGILNSKDLCPDTQIGDAVNSDGCPKAINLHITFENNSAAIVSASEKNLQKYATFLRNYTNYSAKIVGYTDSRGSAAYNQKLSEKRAAAVAKDLINRGVNPRQISSAGAGEASPIATNDTAEGRAQNRRIEADLTRN